METTVPVARDSLGVYTSERKSEDCICGLTSRRADDVRFAQRVGANIVSSVASLAAYINFLKNCAYRIERI